MTTPTTIPDRDEPQDPNVDPLAELIRNLVARSAIPLDQAHRLAASGAEFEIYMVPPR